MTQLTSIGTLFAFVLVSWGVLVLPRPEGVRTKGFRMPYVNGRFIVPILFALFAFLFRHRIAMALTHFTEVDLQEVLFLIFVLLAAGLTLGTIIRKYSLIPVVGVLFCDRDPGDSLGVVFRMDGCRIDGLFLIWLSQEQVECPGRQPRIAACRDAQAIS
jgi:hypothetical protein